MGAWAQGANFPEIEVQPKLAEFLGVSVQFLIHGIPVKGDPLTWQAEEERRADYVKSRKETMGDFPKDQASKRAMTLTPKFSSTPTREDCESYLKGVLDVAPAAGVSYGFILRKLKNALPPADFEPDEKER